VGDDGVEMQVVPRVNSAGQGTSIVEARVRKLGATVQVTDAHRGTRVSIVHA
jgi:two-component sensor histidine kinase